MKQACVTCEGRLAVKIIGARLPIDKFALRYNDLVCMTSTVPVQKNCCLYPTVTAKRITGKSLVNLFIGFIISPEISYAANMIIFFYNKQLYVSHLLVLASCAQVSAAYVHRRHE